MYIECVLSHILLQTCHIYSKTLLGLANYAYLVDVMLEGT
jgi:hypothetical protein